MTALPLCPTFTAMAPVGTRFTVIGIRLVDRSMFIRLGLQLTTPTMPDDVAMHGYPADVSSHLYAYTAGQPYPTPCADGRSDRARGGGSRPTPRPAAKGVAVPSGPWEAFHQGNYRERCGWAAMRQSTCLRNARVHELMSLALFTLKDYRGAAMEAHAAVALGPISDWAQSYGYYGNLEAYTKPLDAVVDYVRKNPTSAEGRFLLAYHDLMMGHHAEGKEQLRT